ncbi:MAG: hypothetical protein J6W81_03970 [Lentisphaeria bacterium]|nr:hypothetical protein [Lentisphaeria bacterium]
MQTELQTLLRRYMEPGQTLALVGVGAFGRIVRDAAVSLEIRVLLCDPPRMLEDSEELGEAIRIQWGNGMGGCDFSTIQTETFLPLESVLKSADAIAVQVPLSAEPPFATEALFTAERMALCKSSIRLLNFSDPAVIAPELRCDPRIIQF